MRVRKHIHQGVLGVERYVRRLRKSDNTAKQRWLIGAVMITMVCIIVLWIVYIDVTLPSIVAEAPEEISAPETGDDGATSTFMRGLGIVTQRVGNGVERVVEQLRGVIEYAREAVLESREFSIERE